MTKTKYLVKVEENNNPSSSVDDLPTSIFYDILVKLPYKCLQRSKCVAKSWLSHISSSDFTVLHRRHSLELSIPDQYSPYRLLVFNSHHECLDRPSTFDHDSIYSIDLDDSLEECSLKKISLPPSLEMLRDKYVVSCCNGLLLCVGLGDRDDMGIRKAYLVVVINPSTGAYREISRLQVTCDQVRMIPKGNTYGLAYDSSTDDYKVIMLAYRSIIGWDVWVYSLRVGSWRWVARNDQKDHRPFFGMFLIRHNTNNAVLIDNHLLHWLFVSHRSQKPRGIACFDVCNEEWNHVPLPENGNIEKNHFNIVQLGVLDGCLCFLAGQNPPQKLLYEVMVMKEYGVKESWIKLFNISDSFDIRFSLKVCPIAYSPNRTEILLRRDSRSRIFWYNLRDKTMKMALVPRLEMLKKSMSICNCIQTLAPFPGCSNPRKAK